MLKIREVRFDIFSKEKTRYNRSGSKINHFVNEFGVFVVPPVFYPSFFSRKDNIVTKRTLKQAKKSKI